MRACISFIYIIYVKCSFTDVQAILGKVYLLLFRFKVKKEENSEIKTAGFDSHKGEAKSKQGSVN